MSMTATKIQYKILNSLIDSYEKSKTFIGENQVKQTFSKRIENLFPKYRDDSEYELFCLVNEAVGDLRKKKLVDVLMLHGNVIDKVTLNVDCLEDAYEYIKRSTRCSKQLACRQILKRFDTHPVLHEYVKSSLDRLDANKDVEYYHDDEREFEKLLMVVERLLANQEECFIRDFSMALFHDSKAVQKYVSNASSLLYKYGDFMNRDSVFEECGVVDTPTYICIKGAAKIKIADQWIDLSLMQGDIALSTATVDELEEVHVSGNRVVTIENMTSFHTYSNKDDFVIYLGGFHNRLKRTFLMRLYEQNSSKEYLHFGDIDAGGFYILEHLKRKTKIPFMSLNMNVETLSQYRDMTKPLSANDRRRIQVLIDKSDIYESEDYREVLNYMLQNDCKLEQEAVASLCK